MAEFIIETGFNAADETMNFGTRCIGDGTNLYESSTLACLKSESGQISESSINAVVHNEKIFFNVGKSMTIFEDKNCTNIMFNGVMDDSIDTFSSTPDAKYLFLCLKNGTVYLIDVSNGNNCLFNECLEENCLPDQFFVSSFNEIYNNMGVSFLAVTRNGKVYRVSIVFQNVQEDSSDNKEVEMKEKVVSEEIHNFSSQVRTAAFNFPTLIVNGSKLSVYNVKTKECVSVNSYNLKSICFLEHLIIGLDLNGNLVRICPMTLLLFPMDIETVFRDVRVVSGEHESHVIGVTQKNENVVPSHIQLLTYPDFSTIYSIKLSHDVCLIQPEFLVDETLYISKIVSTDGYITELRFHVIFETEPEKRLERLVKKQRFEEAEKFAKTFNLDPVIIQKARAQMIVDKTTCDSEDITKLIELLESIDDDYFKMTSCQNVDCITFEDVRKILSYGSTAPLSGKGGNKEEVLVMQKVLTELLFKFDTYMAMYSKYDVQTWSTFCTCDFIEELKSHLSKYHTEEAIILFSRLDHKIVKDLSEETIDEILSILNNQPINVYEPFLPTFIPTTLSHNPQSLPVFVRWLLNRVINLEKRSNNFFPDNAIRFAENIIQMLAGKNSGMMFQRQCILNKQCLNDLNNLMSALRGIQTLKNNYRVEIPLSEYLMGPKTIIRKILNLSVSPEDYDILLREFLCTFILQNHFEPNEIFLNEIKNLMAYDKKYWVAVVPSILKCMTSIEAKIEAVKLILKSRLPWCDAVRKMGQYVLQYNHPQVSEIKEIIENEPMMVVLAKPKYKIKEKTNISDINCLKFTINRIIYVNELTMIEDIYELCREPAFRHEANITLFYHFFQMGDLETALSILDNNAPEEILKCSLRLIGRLEDCIASQSARQPSTIKENAYKMLKSLSKRIEDNMKNDFELTYTKQRIETLRKLYSVNKEFKTSFTPHNLISNVERKNNCADLLDEVVHKYENGNLDSITIWPVIDNISYCFSLDKNYVLIQFCNKLEDFDVTLKAAEQLYESDKSAKNLCLIALSLLKFIGTKNVQLSESTDLNESNTFLLNSPSCVDNETIFRGLRLAEQIVVRAVMIADRSELHQCMEVANWVNSCFYLSRSGQKSDLQKKLFPEKFFTEKATVPGLVTFNSVKQVLTVYCGFMQNFGSMRDTYLTHFNFGIAPVDMDGLVQQLRILSMTVDDLCREGQHLTAYKLVITLRNGLLRVPTIQPEIIKMIHTIIAKRCVPQLIQAVASSTYIDESFFYNLLLMCDKTKARTVVYHYLELYKQKRNATKLSSIANLGLRLLRFHNTTEGKPELVAAILNVKWWKKIQNCQMSYSNFFSYNCQLRLQKLIRMEYMDCEMIAEYCDDFNFDKQSNYILYLKTLLMQWKPNYEITTDITGKRRLVVKDDYRMLYDKCESVIDVIDCKDRVVNLMNEIWSTINFYHYEVFLCILNILSKINTKTDNSRQKKMVYFLQSYKRHSPPGQAEIEHWYTVFPDMQAVDVLSEFRLPFTHSLFTGDIWNIIRPEINLISYKLWFEAIDILKNINKNDICTFVVKEIVKSGVLKSNSASTTEEEWCLYPKHTDLLTEVDACVKYITNLEMATSALYHLMTHVPKGIDRVNVAELCYKYAQKYKKENESSVDVQNAFIKVQKKYYSFSALHILHIYQLNEEKYEQLVAHPNDLVKALYMDERIVKNAESVDLHCPDINKAVDALAVLFKMDIDVVRHNLLKNYLTDGVDMDSTMLIMSSIQKPTTDYLGNDDQLKRAAYICSSGDITFWQKFLFKAGMSEDENFSKKPSYQARALRCLCAISDRTTIKQLSGVTLEEFLNFIDKLSLISELEYLGFSFDVEALDKSNKKDMLKRLAQQANKSLPVRIMATLCMTYFIFNQKYWEFIINSALSLKMFYELKMYIQLPDMDKFRYKTFYINAWQKIIDNAFNVDSFVQDEELTDVFVENFLMIQSCPVLYSLNLEYALKKCISLDKHEFAAVLLQFLPSDKTELYINNISNCETDSIFKKLDKLVQRGIWGVPKVKSLLGSYIY